MVVVLRHSICAFNYSSLTAETVWRYRVWSWLHKSNWQNLWLVEGLRLLFFFYLLLLFYFFNTAILKNKIKEILKYNKIILALTILAGKDLMSHSVQYMNSWFAASDLFDMFTQSIKFYAFHYQYRCLKNVIYQIDSKNGWLFFSASFTSTFRLVSTFGLKTGKHFFLRGFIFKPKNSIGSSKKRYLGFSK